MLAPKNPTSYRTILSDEEAATSWKLRGAWLLDVIRHPSFAANEYIYLPAGWLEPVIYVGEHFTAEAIAGLRRLGYGYVYAPATTFDTVWALQPYRTLIKLQRAFAWHRLAAWLYWRHALAVTTRDGVVVRLRDLRPNLWPFNRGCRKAGQTVR